MHRPLGPTAKPAMSKTAGLRPRLGSRGEGAGDPAPRAAIKRARKAAESRGVAQIRGTLRGQHVHFRGTAVPRTVARAGNCGFVVSPLYRYNMEVCALVVLYIIACYSHTGIEGDCIVVVCRGGSASVMLAQSVVFLYFYLRS